jgi:hypothetical protein
MQIFTQVSLEKILASSISQNAYCERARTIFGYLKQVRTKPSGQNKRGVQVYTISKRLKAMGELPDAVTND